MFARKSLATLFLGRTELGIVASFEDGRTDRQKRLAELKGKLPGSWE